MIHNGYDYGPIVIESAVWIVVLAIMAALAWLVSLLWGDFQEFARFLLTIGFMLLLSPVIMYGGAYLLGIHLPSLDGQ